MPNVTSIGDNAFANSNVSNIYVPNVTTIGNYAFENTQLVDVSMPSATIIGDSAFAQNSSLNIVDMPNVTTIGQFAFENTSNLTDIIMPNVETIGSQAFYQTNLSGIELPNVINIGEQAFREAQNLASVYVPKVQTIGERAFDDIYNLTSIYMPIVKYIGNAAFQHYTGSVELPDSLEFLGLNAFNEAREIIISDSVNTNNWDNDAFSYDSDTNVVIKCKGEQILCQATMKKFIQDDLENGYCNKGYCLDANSVSFASVSESLCIGNYYWSGTSCNNKRSGITCAEN